VAGLAKGSHRLEPFHAGHAEVRENQINGLRDAHLEGLRPVGGFEYVEVLFPQNCCQKPSDSFVIVNDQDIQNDASRELH